MTTPVRSRAPRWRDAALWAAPVGVRCLFLGLIFGGAGLAWTSYLGLSDGGSFLALAHAIADPARRAAMTFYDSRVFPGWPLCEALFLGIGLPEPAVLAVTVLLAGLATWLFFRLTQNYPLALLLGMAPPAWILASIHPVSEAFYLTLGLLAAIALQSRRFAFAGLCAGAMIATRPFGIAWAAAALVVAALECRRTGAVRPLWALAAGLGGGFLALPLVNLRLYGELWHQARVYAAPLAELNLRGPAFAALGQPHGHWGPPFWHVLTTPWFVPTPWWKIVYIYGHVAALLVLAPLAVRRLRALAAAGDLGRVFLLGSFLVNGCLIVCAGPYWGFHSFDRYFVWGLPGALVALEPVLPPKPLPWVLAGAGASLLAAGVYLSLHVF